MHWQIQTALTCPTSVLLFCCASTQANAILLGFSIAVLCLAVIAGALWWVLQKAAAEEKELQGKLSAEEEEAVRAGSKDAACYVSSGTLLNPQQALANTRPGECRLRDGHQVVRPGCCLGLSVVGLKCSTSLNHSERFELWLMMIMHLIWIAFPLGLLSLWVARLQLPTAC